MKVLLPRALQRVQIYESDADRFRGARESYFFHSALRTQHSALSKWHSGSAPLDSEQWGRQGVGRD